MVGEAGNPGTACASESCCNRSFPLAQGATATDRCEAKLGHGVRPRGKVIVMMKRRCQERESPHLFVVPRC